MELSMNGIYHIELQAFWGKKYDVKIEGTVSPAAVQKLSSNVNLKKEFFDDYGISISNYLRLLPSNSMIYIGRPVTSFDPVEISDQDNDRQFIPETLIDYMNTYLYVLAKRYVFEVSSGIKRYKNVLVEDRFFKDIRKKISDKFKTIDDFVADNISTEVKGVDILTTDVYLDSVEKEQKEIIDRFKAFSIQRQNNSEDAQRALYEQTIKAREAQNEYLKKKTELEMHLSDITAKEAQNIHINNILIEVEACIREVLGILSSDPKFEGENIPTFNELYDKAKEIVNNRS
jgi:hypothetical protein